MLYSIISKYWSTSGNNHIYSCILEKAMAPHSSSLAWKIPWIEEPGGLQSMGSLGVGQDWDFTFTFHFHALEKEMATTPVFLPGESQVRGSLVGCHLWGRTESDTTKVTAAAAELYLGALLILFIFLHVPGLLFPWIFCFKFWISIIF